MQQSRPPFALGCRVGTMLEKEPCQVPMQRSRPLFALGRRVSTVLNEELGHVQMTAFGCPMQQSQPRVRPVLLRRRRRRAA
jgi:hypothetical protein